MALNTISQINELVNKAQNILITFPNVLPAGDNLCSGLSLKKLLNHKGKKADIVSNLDFKKYDFLNSETGKQTVQDLKAMSILKINKEIKNFYYEKEDKNLLIYLTAKDSPLELSDIHLQGEKFPYDLIITLNAPDLHSLKALFKKNTHFFYQTLIINIDYNPANENFGQINLINIKAASISEIVFDLIKNINAGLFTEKIATLLLCGLIEKTNCFKNIKTAPQTLSLAAKLLEHKADKDLIIKHLYQNKTVNQIKLWGRALARLKNMPGKNIFWSLIQEKDFEKSKTTISDFKEVFEEFLAHLPEYGQALLFADFKQKTYIALKSFKNNTADLEMSFLEYQPRQINSSLFFEIDKPLLEAEKIVLEKVCD